jgi:DNA gyrase subunit A
MEMRLYKLIGLEIDALMDEHNKTLAAIEKYTDILNNYDSMAKVIIDELRAYKKAYAVPRKTLIEDAEQVVFEEKKAEEFPVVFLMDRFGYARCIDESVYEKNREAADTSSQFVVHCMSEGRLCVFTNTGKSHILKVADVPFGKFRDKGTPIDNLCNYDSRVESFVQVVAMENLTIQTFLFITRKGMVKRVLGDEFDVTKRTIQATGLQDNDEVLAVRALTDENQIVMASAKGFLLRFGLEQIPYKKKGAVGVRGMKLAEDDLLENIYLIGGSESPTEAQIGEKKVSLTRLHIANRDTKGTRVRS